MVSVVRRLTSRGVSNMIQFWLGEQGYKPYLDSLRKESGQTLESADTQANQSTNQLLRQLNLKPNWQPSYQ